MRHDWASCDRVREFRVCGGPGGERTDRVRKLSFPTEGDNQGRPVMCQPHQAPRWVCAGDGRDAERPARPQTGRRTRGGTLAQVWQSCVSLRLASLPGNRSRGGFGSGSDRERIAAGRSYLTVPMVMEGVI